MRKFAAVLAGTAALTMTMGFSAMAYTIGFEPYTLTNEYFSAVLNGVQIACEETGNELIYFDPQGDPTKQASQVEDMIASGIDAIIYLPYDSSSCRTTLQTLKDAGVAVINIDTVVEEGDYDLVDAIIASDNMQLGELAGRVELCVCCHVSTFRRENGTKRTCPRLSHLSKKFEITS